MKHKLINTSEAIEMIRSGLNLKKLHSKCFRRYRELKFISIHSGNKDDNNIKYEVSNVLLSIKRISEYRAKNKIKGNKSEPTISADSGYNLFSSLMNQCLIND